MVRPRSVPGRSFAAFVAAAALGLMLQVASEADGDGPATRPVSGGVYSDGQAESGREAFALHCAHCHGSDLRGGFGPSLVPLDPWAFGGGPLSRVFDLMRTEMPFDAPGSLDDEVYASILAYVLLENGFPSGADPLPASTDALAAFELDDPPAD
ncbi:MAG: c-type cytochrome [Trueperaceae bacterium]|nr:c-type cytochrome [Trueperaceae bacterium]